MEFLMFGGAIMCFIGILSAGIWFSIKRSKARIIPGSEWVRDDSTDNPFLTVQVYTVSEVSEDHLTYRDNDSLYTTDKFKFLERYKPRPTKEVKEDK